MMFLYLLGIFIAIASGLLLKTFVYNGQPVPFVMELPAYRLPTARNIMLHMWSKAKDFLYKAFYCYLRCQHRHLAAAKL